MLPACAGEPPVLSVRKKREGVGGKKRKKKEGETREGKREREKKERRIPEPDRKNKPREIRGEGAAVS